MIRRNTGIRRWPGATLMVAAVLASAGCSTATSGTATEQPYQPPDAQNLTLSPVELSDDLVGMDSSLSTGVMRIDGQLCVVPLAEAVPDVSHPVCIDGIEPDWQGSAVFAPDSAHVALFSRAAAGGEWQSWIVDTGTGHTSPLEPAAGSATSNSGAATSPGSIDDPDEPAHPATMLTGAWSSGTDLIAFSLKAVYRFDIGSGTTTVLDRIEDREVGERVLIGGDTAAVQIGSSVLPIDLRTWQVGEQIELADDGRPLLLGVSPDGTTLLATSTDLVRFLPGPLELIKVRDGSRTTVEFPDERYFTAGAFSPDGSQAIVFSTGTGDRVKTIDVHLVAAADGSVAEVGTVETPVYGPQVWNRQNWLTPTDLRFYPDGGALRMSG